MRSGGDGSDGKLLSDGRTPAGRGQPEHEAARVARLGCHPDASTICRFRNRLVKAELDQKLLALINSQLEQRGLKVQGARGAIIDATIIPSAARPRQHVEGQGEQTRVIDSADRDVRWVKKSQQAFFGYRGHTAVDSEDGYVEHVQVHPANEAEINKLAQIVEALTPGVEAVLADKGYASKSNRQWLAERGIGDLIQHKGSGQTGASFAQEFQQQDRRHSLQGRAGARDDEAQIPLGQG